MGERATVTATAAAAAVGPARGGQGRPRGLRWGPVLVAALAAALVAVVGGLLTDLGPWYRGLAKPSWQPPDWLFGPAWTVIFTLTAAAGVRAWAAAPDAGGRRLVILLFAVNGVLNAAWSLLFFRLHRPDWALAEVAVLWLSILSLVVATGQYARLSAWLLLPYLAWVSFAGVLNAAVVRLNGPFS